MAFLKSVQINFKEIEYELEEQGKRIDWDDAFWGVQEACYKIVNDEFCEYIATNGDDITRKDMFQWITERLLDELPYAGVNVIEINENGNPINEEEQD
jgi:hypothetical protein